VHKISIVPRGRALGYTLNLPEEDRYLKTREELVDHMTVLLGGRVAEEVVFGAITTGAADDLKRVAEIAAAMVTEYAMGGTATAHPAPELASDATRRRRDEEQEGLADEARRAAYALITAHRAVLDGLAGALLEHETIERADIERIVGDTPRAERSGGGRLRVAAAQPPSPEPN